MESLGEEAARELFEHHASDGDQRGRSWKPDANLIDKIVKGCKLHPLALKVIGGSLKGRDEREWRYTADRLEQTGGTFGDEPGGEIIGCLSTSLELLTRKERECFLDLGSFPEDQTVPATAVIDMWTETCDDLKDGEMEERENGAYKILRELERRNLVKLIDRKGGGAGDPNGSFSSLYVRQHDLLRELAIHEIQRQAEGQIMRLIMENRMDKIPDTWAQTNGRTTQAKLVSIDTGDMEKSDWPDLNLSKAEVLILNFSATSYHLPPFLQRMKNLKVLIVANHSSDRAALDGLYLLSSLEKLRRVMFRKISLPMELPRGYRSSSQVLHKLSLVLYDSLDLQHIPSLFPSVRDLDIGYCTDMDELSNTIYVISRLEKLSITNCPDLVKLPEGIGKLSKLKVLRLQACGKLECLPQSLSELPKLRFLDISYCLNLEAFSEEMGNLGYLEKIDMRFCSRYSIELPPSMVHLESLKKVVCDEEVASLWISRGLDPSKLEVRKEEANLGFLY